MRILILDDSKSYGDLLASACKKLGHASASIQDPAEALNHLKQEDVDVLLVDLDMPSMKGTVFAALVRQQGFALPIGICTGNCDDEALADKARSMGQVLPKIWTHADLRSMLRALQVEGRQHAVGAPLPTAPMSNPSPATVDDYGAEEQTLNDPELPVAVQQMARGTGATDKSLIVEDTTTIPGPLIETSVPTAPALAPMSPSSPSLRSVKSPSASQIRKTAPRVHIRCSNWEQVRRLCTDVAGGRTQLKVRAVANLAEGQTVVLALALPDEMVVSIEARVVGTPPGSPDGVNAYHIQLVDLDAAQIAYLLERCDEQEMTSPVDTAPVVAQPTERPQVPLAPSTSSNGLPSIPDSIDSVDSMKDVPSYAPKISWD